MFADETPGRPEELSFKPNEQCLVSSLNMLKLLTRSTTDFFLLRNRLCKTELLCPSYYTIHGSPTRAEK